MQEKKRKVGTRDIRLNVLDAADVAHDTVQYRAERDAAYQDEYRAALDQVNYDPSQFTYYKPTYQLLAEQSNIQVESALNMVHTTESMMRARDVVSTIPLNVGDDFKYASEGKQLGSTDEDFSGSE